MTNGSLKATTVPDVSCGCETWSLAMRGKKYMLRVFENRVLGGDIWGREARGNRGNGENYIMRSFVICTAGQILLC